MRHNLAVGKPYQPEAGNFIEFGRHALLDSGIIFRIFINGPYSPFVVKDFFLQDRLAGLPILCLHPVYHPVIFIVRTAEGCRNLTHCGKQAVSHFRARVIGGSIMLCHHFGFRFGFFPAERKIHPGMGDPVPQNRNHVVPVRYRVQFPQ